MKTKNIVTLLGIAALGLGGSQVYAEQNIKISQLDKGGLRELRESGDRDAFKQRAQELGLKKLDRPKLSDDQKVLIDGLKESQDHEAIRIQLDEWGIEKPLQREGGKGLKKGHIFQDLTDNQKEELQELRESDDKELVREKLLEFGVEFPEKPERLEVTDEQKEKIQELKDAGDKEAVRAYFEEIGLAKNRKFMKKRAGITDALSEDEKEVIQEARDIARAGDKETAKELLQDVFGVSLKEEAKERGIIGFFKRIF